MMKWVAVLDESHTNRARKCCGTMEGLKSMIDMVQPKVSLAGRQEALLAGEYELCPRVVLVACKSMSGDTSA